MHACVPACVVTAGVGSTGAAACRLPCCCMPPYMQDRSTCISKYTPKRLCDCICMRLLKAQCKYCMHVGMRSFCSVARMLERGRLEPAPPCAPPSLHPLPTPLLVAAPAATTSLRRWRRIRRSWASTTTACAAGTCAQRAGRSRRTLWCSTRRARTIHAAPTSTAWRPAATVMWWWARRTAPFGCTAARRSHVPRRASRAWARL
mmetsp:Transcript_43069/g.129345  ORF Transcript_43069/g.129345 Transcript_43069/m.129345 type:complete len:204 (+) Transcript_43069:1154-1765(+)